MEAVSNPFCVEYQMHSLIDFLLGDHRHVGWLDTYAGWSSDRSPNPLTDPQLKRHAAAA